MVEQAYIVIGANYGDEGKGRVTNILCSEAAKKGMSCVNVLTNGGAQRGHTVISKDASNSHVFHHFGSGTYQGATTCFSKDFILNPRAFLLEYTALMVDGISPGKLCPIRDSRCRWSTPWDVMTNQIIETARGNWRHGSCGMGIWETVLRYQHMPDIPTLSEFSKLSERDKRLHCARFRDYSISRIIYILEGNNHLFTPQLWYAKSLEDDFIHDIDFMVGNTSEVVNAADRINDFSYVVMENGQGLLLDSKEDNPHTTPSRTNAAPNIESVGIDVPVTPVYVTRSFLTRHGAGDFPEEYKTPYDLPADDTNVENEWQGSIRYGELNPTELHDRIMEDISKIDNKHMQYPFIIAVTFSDVCNMVEKIEDAFKKELNTGKARIMLC